MLQADMITTLRIVSAQISPNPANINSKITISVEAREDVIDPYYHAGEIFCGEI